MKLHNSILIALILLSPLVSAERLVGKVVGISDGDTITLLSADKVSHKIRLSEIDAPEKGQPWGTNSKEALSKLIFSKTVEVETTERDRYGRVLGIVFLDERNMNKAMVERGNAWAYTRYVKDPGYFSLQQKAKTERVGLWSQSDDKIAPPWEWRRK